MVPNHATRQLHATTVVDRIAEACARVPNHAAIVDERGPLTLEELWKSATLLAGRLSALPSWAQESRGGLLLPRDRSVPIAMLACMLAGGAFLPLDPSWPAERLDFILADAQCHALITSRGMPESRWLGTRIDIAESGNHPSCAVRPDMSDLAYVIYTSGSTGQPKGVLMEHGPLANLIAAVDDILYAPPAGATEGEIHRETLTAPFVFDVTIQQVFSALTGACSLHIVSDTLRRDPAALVAYFRRHRISLINVVVSHLALLLENDLESAAPALKHIVTGGETLSLPVVGRLYEQPGFSHLTLVNMYGPAENCIDSTCFVIDARTFSTLDHVPLGHALPGTKIVIVGDDGERLPAGETGEICLAGIGLARGYLNRPETTARSFVRSPHVNSRVMYRTGDLGRYGPDGLLEFRGRRDNQVKIAGRRIELEEVEHQLQSIAGHSDIAVVYQKREHGGRLAALTAGACASDIDRLRAKAMRVLPAYMVPGVFVHLDGPLPLTHNGKVHREALVDLLPAVCPSPEASKRINSDDVMAQLWQDLLGVAAADPHAGFLSLGGDSIAAMRLVAAIRRHFQVEVPLETVLSDITLADLQQFVMQEGRSSLPIASHMPPAPCGNDHPASSAQRRLWYLSQLDHGGVLYNVPIYRELGSLDPERVRATMRRLVDRHPALRTSLVLSNGELRQRTRDTVDFPFMVDDLREAADPDALAAALAMSDAWHPFDLTHAPPFRLRLVQLGEARWHFLLVIHHCHVDGWAIAVLLDEFNRLYDDPAAELTAARPYVDFAHWEERRDLTEDLRFWRDVLTPRPPLIAFPSLSCGEPTSGGTVRVAVSSELTSRVTTLALHHAVTPAIIMLSHYLVFLNRLTGQSDLCVGMGVANRPDDGFERTVGCFVNVVPIRVALTDQMTLNELYARVGHSMRMILAHQSLPLNLMQFDDPSVDGAPFNVLFAWQSFESIVGDVQSPVPMTVAGQLRQFDFSFGKAKFDLSLYVYAHGDALELVLEYRTACIGAAQAGQWLQAFHDLLDCHVHSAPPGESA
ncbi:non-ribosomal peptide synthetase [Candidatus Paraburkholderia calva]|nr:non-ribosomal peptide synthetase [Candidatus Paraburkholderia calva]